MKKPVFDPAGRGPRMKVVCFVSGSGTNYEKIVERNPQHDYVVFTNRPDCRGAQMAKHNKHALVVLSHVPYLKAARARYGGNVPRNSPEREEYEREACRRIEEVIGGQPDLVCLAGYDLWTTDFLVDRYYPRILNVHPGDTTKGYAGLGWVASARAILAGETAVRSTLFFVDKTEDGGPVLLQSRPLDIRTALAEADAATQGGLLNDLRNLERFQGMSFDEFMSRAGDDDRTIMKRIGETVQNALKTAGDWEIYPYGVDLIARGLVSTEGTTVYVRNRALPRWGLRMEEIQL